MTIAFWVNDPKILLHKNNLTKIWPFNHSSSFEENLNSATRTLVYIFVLMCFTTRRLAWIPLIGITSLVVVYYKTTRPHITEGHISCTPIVHPTKITYPTKNNPMMNVLLTDIADNPMKNAAAPAFDPIIREQINDKVVSGENILSGIVDPQLYHDLGENINFRNSMQRFYTTANSKIVNDQKAFAHFCYKNPATDKDKLQFNGYYDSPMSNLPSIQDYPAPASLRA
jgi:hypothetical protein